MNVELLLVRLDSAGFTVMCVLFTLLWQSTVLFAACGALAFLLRRRRESVRHALWVSAILLLPLLPILSWTVSKIGAPRREIPVLPAYTATVANTPGVQDVSTFRRAAIPETPSALPTQRGHHVPLRDYPWALALLVYLATAAVLLLLVPAGWLRMRRWIARGEAVLDDRVLAIFEEVRDRIGLRREVALVENEAAAVPLAFGMFRPLVLLPRGFSARLSDSELEAVAAHEFSHLLRRDPLTLTLVALVRAAFFFQPLAWMAAREAAYLAECACDSSVLDLTGEARPYAGLLSRLAEDLPRHPVSAGYAPGFLFSRGVFLRRVEAILSEKRKGMKQLTGLALAGILVVVIVTLAIVLAFGPGKQQAVPVNKQAKTSLKVAEPDTSAARMVTVSGKVVGYDGKPVGGAKVYLFIPHEVVIIESPTTKDGTFSFSHTAKLLYDQKSHKVLIVYGSGYAVSYQELKVVPSMGQIKVMLGPSSKISAILRDTSGHPVVNGWLAVSSIGKGGMWNSCDTSVQIVELTGRSDKTGKAFVTNLPEGAPLTVIASGEGYAYETRRDGMLSGTENIPFMLQPGGRIEGRVTFADTGKPVEEVPVWAYGPENWFPEGRGTTTDRNGHYTIGKIRPGTYKVFFSDHWTIMKGAIPRFDSTSVNVTVANKGQTVRGIDVRLVRSGNANLQDISFVSIPGGTFQMGDVENAGSSDEKPVHTVTLSGFEMSAYEITNAQYAKFLNDAKATGDITPSSTSVRGAKGVYRGQEYIYLSGTLYSKYPDARCWITYSDNVFSLVAGHENWPVVWVTWYGSKAFALYYGLDLPTESEWEYACRGGRQYEYGTDDGTLSQSKANYEDTGLRGPLAVGSYPANPFGLYDMSGNVWEWCHISINPLGVQMGYDLVLKGGGWVTSGGGCRAAFCHYFRYPDQKSGSIGFRVVRRISPQSY